MRPSSFFILALCVVLHSNPRSDHPKSLTERHLVEVYENDSLFVSFPKIGFDLFLNPSATYFSI